MAQEWKCRQCNLSLAGAAHVRLPANLRGYSALCLTCADRQADKHHNHHLHEWVPAYVRSQQQDSPVMALRKEVQELRALLDQLTQPETKEH